VITLHFWPTPNGYKPLILLEELGLPYTLKPVNIFRGAQFAPDFLAIAPNNRIPAMTDDDTSAAGDAIALFESGAILGYLAEKGGRFLPSLRHAHHEVQQWVFWQMAGLGPMMGQAAHFVRFASEDVPYAKARYVAETERLLGVLDRRLRGRDFICGDISIADLACYPWVRIHEIANIEIGVFPAVTEWARRMAERPAVIRAYAIGEPLKNGQEMDDAARRVLFSGNSTRG
jgi:GSH-dependent disulfide-bond oxidoreductase